MKLNPFALLLLGVGLLLLSSSAGGSIGGSPYPLPDGMPVATSMAIDGSITGDQALGKSNPKVVAKIETIAGANNYRLFDVTTATTEPDDKDWVKAAWKDLNLKPGTWNAAGPRGGWKAKALPKTPEEADAAMKRIMK